MITSATMLRRSRVYLDDLAALLDLPMSMMRRVAGSADFPPPRGGDPENRWFSTQDVLTYLRQHGWHGDADRLKSWRDGE